MASFQTRQVSLVDALLRKNVPWMLCWQLTPLPFVVLCDDRIEYTYTIPYFMCVADVQHCIQNCPLSDNGCYTDCRKRSCAAEFPKKYNQSIATSSAPSPSSTNGPQASSLPPGFFGNAGNTNRGVHSWTAVGGSSVLGLIVFLIVGVMFGSNQTD